MICYKIISIFILCIALFITTSAIPIDNSDAPLPPTDEQSENESEYDRVSQLPDHLITAISESLSLQDQAHFFATSRLVNHGNGHRRTWLLNETIQHLLHLCSTDQFSIDRIHSLVNASKVQSFELDVYITDIRTMRCYEYLLTHQHDIFHYIDRVQISDFRLPSNANATELLRRFAQLKNIKSFKIVPSSLVRPQFHAPILFPPIHEADYNIFTDSLAMLLRALVNGNMFPDEIVFEQKKLMNLTALWDPLMAFLSSRFESPVLEKTYYLELTLTNIPRFTPPELDKFRHLFSTSSRLTNFSLSFVDPNYEVIDSLRNAQRFFNQGLLKAIVPNNTNVSLPISNLDTIQIFSEIDVPFDLSPHVMKVLCAPSISNVNISLYSLPPYIATGFEECISLRSRDFTPPHPSMHFTPLRSFYLNHQVHTIFLTDEVDASILAEFETTLTALMTSLANAVEDTEGGIVRDLEYLHLPLIPGHLRMTRLFVRVLRAALNSSLTSLGVRFINPLQPLGFNEFPDAIVPALPSALAEQTTIELMEALSNENRKSNLTQLSIHEFVLSKSTVDAFTIFATSSASNKVEEVTLSFPVLPIHYDITSSRHSTNLTYSLETRLIAGLAAYERLRAVYYIRFPLDWETSSQVLNAIRNLFVVGRGRFQRFAHFDSVHTVNRYLDVANGWH